MSLVYWLFLTGKVTQIFSNQKTLFKFFFNLLIICVLYFYLSVVIFEK
jgi:hypothetical protein